MERRAHEEIISQVKHGQNRNDSDKKGLNEVCVNLRIDSCDWEIPVGETGGEFVDEDVGYERQKFRGSIDNDVDLTLLRNSMVTEEYFSSCSKLMLRRKINISKKYC